MLPIRKALAASVLSIVPLTVSAAPAVADPQLSFVVTPPSYVNSEGQVLLKTEVTCTAGAEGSASAYTQQTRMGILSAGSSFSSIECTGAPQTIWFTITAFSGPGFAPGPAGAQLSANACDAFGCAFLDERTTIRLRR
ncbi:hypothetical protein AB0C77_06385 [Streptomyces sp. NPDC048629]|uniref:hypothetical protein n=1 Tax=Streptomyces sp. NPDC048629 TaxID=3154824 RepID=UPI0034228463